MSDLESGFRASTPPGDNLAYDFSCVYAESFRAIAQHGGKHWERDDDLGLMLVDTEAPMPFLNVVVLTRPLDVARLDAFLDRTQQWFAQRTGGPYGIWSVWPLPDLARAGFHLSGHPPLMMRPPGGAAPAAPPELRIVPVTDLDVGFDYETALVDGFPVPPMQPVQRGCFFFGDVLHAPNWHHFVGYVDGVPVATASAATGPTHLRVDNVATLASHRGRGYGAALTWAATMVRPDLPATLLASDAGRPVYERMGYRSLLRATFWIGMRAN